MISPNSKRESNSFSDRCSADSYQQRGGYLRNSVFVGEIHTKSASLKPVLFIIPPTFWRMSFCPEALFMWLTHTTSSTSLLWRKALATPPELFVGKWQMNIYKKATGPVLGKIGKGHITSTYRNLRETYGTIWQPQLSGYSNLSELSSTTSGPNMHQQKNLMANQFYIGGFIWLSFGSTQEWDSLRKDWMMY